MNYVKTDRMRFTRRIGVNVHDKTCHALAVYFRDLAEKHHGCTVHADSTAVSIVYEEAEPVADMEARHVNEEIKHFAILTDVAVKAALLAERARIHVLVEEAIVVAEGVVIAHSGGCAIAPVIQAYVAAEHRMKVLAMRIGAAA